MSVPVDRVGKGLDIKQMMRGRRSSSTVECASGSNGLICFKQPAADSWHGCDSNGRA